MPQLKYVEGDLFEQIPNDTEPGRIFIPHVCNNQGAWGKGFVIPLAQAMPDSKTAYLEWKRLGTIHEHPSPSLMCYMEATPFGLGGTQIIETVPSRRVHEKPHPSVAVVNMVAQNLGGSRPLHYDHLVRCMKFLRHHMDKAAQHREEAGNSPVKQRILCPMFGSGLAGGDWQFIEQLIVDCWMRDGGYDVTVCYLPQFLPEDFAPPEPTDPTSSLV